MTAAKYSHRRTTVCDKDGGDMVAVIEAIGTAVGAALLVFAKSGYNGWLRKAVSGVVDKRKTAKEAHENISVVLEKLEEAEDSRRSIHERVDEVEDTVMEEVGETQRTIALLHQDDLTDDQHAELRERLDVEELDADIVGD